MTITINPALFWFIIEIVFTIATEITLGIIIQNKQKGQKKVK